MLIAAVEVENCAGGDAEGGGDGEGVGDSADEGAGFDGGVAGIGVSGVELEKEGALLIEGEVAGEEGGRVVAGGGVDGEGGGGEGTGDVAGAEDGENGLIEAFEIEGGQRLDDEGGVGRQGVCDAGVEKALSDDGVAGVGGSGAE